VKDLTDKVNSMASTSPARCATSRKVATAIARGDLSRKITVDVPANPAAEGDRQYDVDQLNSFADK